MFVVYIFVLLFVVSTESIQLRRTTAARCQKERENCMTTSDCAFVFSCVKQCGADVSCAMGCSDEVVTKEGTDALNAYRACASGQRQRHVSLNMNFKSINTTTATTTTTPNNTSTRATTSDSEENKNPTIDTFGSDNAIGAAGQGIAYDLSGHIAPSRRPSLEEVSGSESGSESGSQSGSESKSDSEPETKDNSHFEGQIVSALKGVASQFVAFADLEACVGCNFVWATVKKELGDGPHSMISVQETFEEICQDMPDVFYESCDDMMDQAGWLSDLFSKGDIKTTELCDKSGICGEHGAQALFDGSKRSLGGDVTKKLMSG